MVSGWLPYFDQAAGYQSFVNNADLFSELSPFWYEFSSTGISAYPNAADPSVVAGAQSSGALVIPTINNAFDPAPVHAMLSDSVARKAHEKALVKLVTANDYDGIGIDYENLYATDRDDLTAFVQQLASALHDQGKRLGVALTAKTSGPGTWNGPQAEDYAAIGAAADRVQVMAYDYSYDGSIAGPIAPLSWVDAVASYTANQIAPSKVELGMPLYGYDWVGTSATSLTYAQVVSLISATGAVANWSSTDGEHWFTYTVSGVAHTVWYSDGASVEAALPIVSKYGLAGVALWRLGGEDAGVWKQFRAV